MKKLFSLSIVALLLTFAAKATLTGSSSICLGYTGYAMDSLNAGGVWSSSNTAVATIDATGTIYPVSVGTVTLTYTYGTPPVVQTMNVTIDPAAPPAITGPSSVCSGGATITLANTVSGGTWSSSVPSRATVDATTGVVTGVSAGSVAIYYYAGGSPCPAIKYITVTGASSVSVYGPSSVCASGGTITLSDSSSTSVTGTWSSSNPSIATVDAATGVVTGVTVGTVTITFTYTTSCGTGTATKVINVINTSSAGTISGTASVYVGASATLHSTVSGGTWTSSNPSVATINTTSGSYTGVAVGSATMTYTVSGCGGIATAVYNISVTNINGISGNVVFSSGGYYGQLKIWLITYNPTTLDLQAVDSITTYANGTTKYYQFLNAPTDSYRVKAAVYDSLGLTTGYIPTYHNSSFYWYSANVINHVFGTADVNKHINMMVGTPTTGPGFISGNVTTGANKGTSGATPVVGLNMVLLNSSGGTLQSVRTDASGSYTFNNLPAGTYSVFPDSLNYTTIPYNSITLTTAAPNMTAASFIQHTLSMQISPIETGIGNVNSSASVVAFPNPASSKLNLQWTAAKADNGTVTITDITGREVYSSVISINAGSGIKQIDLSSFTNGLYVISVKGATLSYTAKVTVQH